MEVQALAGDRVRVTFTGRLDTPGVARVETAFTAAVVPSGRSALVDLSKVEFVGSLGVRMFIAVARSLSRKGAKLLLMRPQTQVREVFEHVALSDIVPVFGTETEALRALEA